VALVAVVSAGCSGGGDEQPPDAQKSPQTQTASPAQTRPQQTHSPAETASYAVIQRVMADGRSRRYRRASPSLAGRL
jgi:hypothetical protein